MEFDFTVVDLIITTLKSYIDIFVLNGYSEIIYFLISIHHNPHICKVLEAIKRYPKFIFVTKLK